MLAVHRIIALLLLCLSPFAARASDGEFVWARSMGGTKEAHGNGIAVDSAGNVYTTGYFTGWADFDPGAGTPGGCVPQDAQTTEHFDAEGLQRLVK